MVKPSTSVLFGVLLFARGFAGTFVVTETTDSGAGSLRQAILDANATPEADLIQFSIGAGGAKTIVVSSALPEITAPVQIDGSTQPQFAGKALIEINGNQRDLAVLIKVSAGSSILRHLVVNNVGRNSGGDCLVLDGPGGNIVEDCVFGLDQATGAVRRRIRDEAIEVTSPNNIIRRNVISGSRRGVAISGAVATGNRIENNVIGLTAAGDTAESNVVGVYVLGAGGNTIGPGNRVAGNTTENIRIEGDGAVANRVIGNAVGLTSSGLALTPTPGTANGVRIQNAVGNTVGGALAGEANTIANCATGVLIDGPTAADNIIQGNFIGTSADGTSAIGNHTGIRIGGGSQRTRVGGTSAGAGNLVSGNRVDGIHIQDSGNNLVQGNRIGTDVTGLVRIANTLPGTDGSGIAITSLGARTANNLVGGAAPGARNIIAGNNGAGVSLSGTQTEENLVQGNYIGVGANGSTPLGNRSRGVEVLGANRNLVGGETRAHGNLIAHSGMEGVWLASTFGSLGIPGVGNAIQFNSIANNTGPGVIMLTPNRILSNDIFGNGGIPIDRLGDGPSANSNLGESNFPELTSATLGSIVVSGRFRGRPACLYLIQVFRNGRFVHGFLLTTGPDRNASFDNVVVPDPEAKEDDRITATATRLCFELGDADPETSEMSPEVRITRVAGIPVVGFEKGVFTGYENEGRVCFKLKRSGNTAQRSSVEFEPRTRELISSWAASASVVQFGQGKLTVTFEAGETEKTVCINFMNDSAFSGTRVFEAFLSGPVNATLGRAETAMFVIDEDPAPPFRLTFDPVPGGLKLAIDPPPASPVVIQRAEDLVDREWFNAHYTSIEDVAVLLGVSVSQYMRAYYPEEYIEYLDIILARENGTPAGDIKVGVAGSEPGFQRRFQYAPAGRGRVVLRKDVMLTDPETGTSKTFQNELETIVDLAAEQVTLLGLKVAIEAEAELLTPACKASPWAAVVGGLIGDERVVSVSGGSNGFSIEPASVTVTGPNGVEFALRPDERREISPAAPGVWKVTTKVCGKTRTAEISVP